MSSRADTSTCSFIIVGLLLDTGMSSTTRVLKYTAILRKIILLQVSRREDVRASAFLTSALD